MSSATSTSASATQAAVSAVRRSTFWWRRSTWRRCSHRLFGVVGLDPCGNIVWRWNHERSGSTGWWVQARALPSQRVFPLSGTVATRLCDPNVAPASLRCTYGADGVLQIPAGQRITDDAFRVSRRVSANFKAFYYIVCVLSAFVTVCAYYRIKTRHLTYGQRRTLQEWENRLAGALAKLVPLEPSSLGPIAGAAEEVWAYAAPTLKTAAVALGYDEGVYQLDAQYEATVQWERAASERRLRRQRMYWTFTAWLASIFMVIVVLAL